MDYQGKQHCGRSHRRSWALPDRAARGRVCGGYATTRPCPETPWSRARLPASAGLRRQNDRDASAIGCGTAYIAQILARPRWNRVERDERLARVLRDTPTRLDD